MPTLVVLALFLFSGLTVQAQVFTGENDGVTEITVNQLGKTAVQYMDVTNAISAIKQEIGVSYPVVIADESSPANAAQIYGQLLLERAEFYISENNEVAGSAHQAWVEVKTLANGKWPNLIDQQDYDDLVVLLSL